MILFVLYVLTDINIHVQRQSRMSVFVHSKLDMLMLNCSSS